MRLQWVLLALEVWLPSCLCTEFSAEKIKLYREKVRSMFYHAYDGYLNYAYPLDELRPISCTGTDTWGSFALTLVDSLDTLIILGNFTEFERAAKLALENIDYNANVNVSVFETNIRVVGGLLSAHMLSGIAGVPLEAGWPCSGPLLRGAERMAQKLLPAFNSMTGMPYGTVNLRYGVHRYETPITCTAGVGTFLLEFGALSRLTGDDRYERIALKALKGLWKGRSQIGLVGNHINVNTGGWTATDAGIGAGVDSYFEYLIKGGILFQKPDLIRQFNEYRQSIDEYMKQDDWFFWVSMAKGGVSMPVFQSLEAFWPGALSLTGDINSAMRILLTYRQVLRQYGFTPEFYNVPNMEAVNKRSGYPLRPELIESTMYLYRATGDPALLQIGVELVEAIEHSTRTRCGYATVKNVKDHSIEDRMESFFLAETTKYLYLLFDPDNFIHNAGETGKLINTPDGKCVINAGGYIFNTEAHPIDPSILYCCSQQRQKDLAKIRDFEENIDFLDMMGLRGDEEDSVSEEFELDEDDLPPDVITIGAPLTPPDMRYSQQETSDDDEIGYSYGEDKEIHTVSTTATSSASVGVASASDDDEFAEDPAKSQLDRPKTIDESAEQLKAAIASLLATQSTTETAPLPALSENITIKYAKPDGSSSFADTVVTALESVMSDWQKLMAVSTTFEKLRSTFSSPKPNSEGYCNPEVEYDCPLGVCRIVDMPSESRGLNIMLNIFHGKSRKFRKKFHPFCLPNEVPKESDRYSSIEPDLGEEDESAEDELEEATISDIEMDYFPYKELGETNFRIMSCPALPFLSRFTGLGFVLPEQ